MYFYGLMASLIIFELWRAHKQQRPLQLKHLASNLACASLLLLSQPFTEQSYLPVFIWLMQHTVLEAHNWPVWLQLPLAILLLDFTIYWLHRLQHTVPIFWATHAPHHQGTQMDFSLSLRQSALAFWFVWLAAVPLLLMSFQREIIVLSLLLHRSYDSLMHYHRPIRFKHWEWLLVSPGLHRVHHGYEHQYRNKNFANVFIIFDRLFGTFQQPMAKEIPIGLDEKKGPIYNPLWANLEPYVALFKGKSVKGLFRFTSDQ